MSYRTKARAERMLRTASTKLAAETKRQALRAGWTQLTPQERGERQIQLDGTLIDAIYNLGALHVLVTWHLEEEEELDPGFSSGWQIEAEDVLLAVQAEEAGDRRYADHIRAGGCLSHRGWQEVTTRRAELLALLSGDPPAEEEHPNEHAAWWDSHRRVDELGALLPEPEAERQAEEWIDVPAE